MSDPKIVLWDIETSHNIVAKFSLREEYVSHTNILQERFVICGAWKTLGEKRVHAVSVLDDARRFKKSCSDDYHVVKTLHGVMSEADVIVAHNGDKFDTKWLNSRILAHGLPPLPPIPSIDTYKVAKKVFNLNSNRLDYIGKYLGLGGKISTPPGLWIDVLKGKRSAIREMVAYNKGDITLLEGVFKKLAPYTGDMVNRLLWARGDSSQCPRPTCRSTNVQSRGYHCSITQVYRRMQCQDCKGWFRLRMSDKTRSAPTRML